MLCGMQISGLMCRPMWMICKDSLREKWRGNQSSSSFGYDPDDKPFQYLNIYLNVSCKPKQPMLDTQDVIVATPSVAKTSVVSTISIPVSVSKLSASCNFLGLPADMCKPSRKCCRVDDSSLLTSHLELMVAFEE